MWRLPAPCGTPTRCLRCPARATSRFSFLDYASHAITDGSDSQGVAYILLQDQRTGKQYWGVGLSHNINLAPLRAILAAINRAKKA